MKQDKTKKVLLEQLRQMPIIEIACKKSGVSRATFYRWKKEDSEFEKLAEVAITEGEGFITDLSESQLISLIKDRSFPAIQLWLKHHNNKYKTKVEISGSLLQIREELTQEETDVLRQALELAGFEENTIQESQNHEPRKTELPNIGHQA
jgi:predicted DNA-binding transcriptional regulator AlpA